MDRRIQINCIVVGLCGVLGAARSDAQAQRPVTLADFRSLKSVDWHMELSPDGQTLAYVSGGDVWLVPTAGDGAPRKVAAGSQPRWSPDRRWLAFYSPSSGSLQLWLLEVRTGETRQLTNLAGGISPDARLRFSGWIGDPLRYGWSPDGTKLVFTSQKEATAGSPTPASLSQSSNVGQGDYTPIILTATTPAAWTLSGLFRYEPQGPRFVDGRFTTAGDTSDATRRAQLVNQLFVVAIATGDTRQITNDDGNYFNPDWSPDGKTIVCASTAGKTPALTDSTDIYAIDPAQGTKSRLTSGGGIKRLPYWSPDGRWVAYASSSIGLQSVFVVPRTGGEPRHHRPTRSHRSDVLLVRGQRVGDRVDQRRCDAPIGSCSSNRTERCRKAHSRKRCVLAGDIVTDRRNRVATQ